MKKYRVTKRVNNISGKSFFIIQKYRWRFFQGGWYWDDQYSLYGIGYLYLYKNEEAAYKMCSYLNGEIAKFTDTILTEKG